LLEKIVLEKGVEIDDVFSAYRAVHPRRSVSRLPDTDVIKSNKR
jgi:hypothetical protein